MQCDGVTRRKPEHDMLHHNIPLCPSIDGVWSYGKVKDVCSVISGQMRLVKA